MNRTHHAPVLAVAVFLVCSSAASGGIISEFTDLGSYELAVGSHTEIAFDEFAVGTVLTTQYLPQGVEFADGNDVIISSGSFVTDGVGVQGSGQIDLLFSSPQTHLGVEFPGALRIDIYDGAALIDSSSDFAGAGTGFFGGIISDMPFDRAVLVDWVDDLVFVDNLHFAGGQVPEPSTLALWSLGAVGLVGLGWRRRKRIA